jgi:hypothetical protein
MSEALLTARHSLSRCQYKARRTCKARAVTTTQDADMNSTRRANGCDERQLRDFMGRWRGSKEERAAGARSA